jgi:putative lipoic acid-binding regulatory protein
MFVYAQVTSVMSLKNQALYVITHTLLVLPYQEEDNLVMTNPSTPPENPRADSLIEYPSQFPIKVMGTKVDGFVHAVTYIAEQFDPTFDASTVELRESKGGNYLGVTITVTATSREQLDELYRTLTSHPLVKVVL